MDDQPARGPPLQNQQRPASLSPRFPSNESGPRLGQPPPSLHRLDSRSSLSPQFPPRQFPPRPQNPPSNFPRPPPGVPGRFLPPGSIRPYPAQRAPFNPQVQASSQIRQRPPLESSNLRFAPPRIVTNNEGLKTPRDKMEDDKRPMSRAEEDDDDDDVVMDDKESVGSAKDNLSLSESFVSKNEGLNPGTKPSTPVPSPSPKALSPVPNPSSIQKTPTSTASPSPAPKTPTPTASPKTEPPSPKIGTPVQSSSPKATTPVKTPSPKATTPVPPSPKAATPVPKAPTPVPSPSPKAETPIQSPGPKNPIASPKDSIASPKIGTPVQSPSPSPKAITPVPNPSPSPKATTPVPPSPKAVTPDLKTPTPVATPGPKTPSAPSPSPKSITPSPSPIPGSEDLKSDQEEQSRASSRLTKSPTKSPNLLEPGSRSVTPSPEIKGFDNGKPRPLTPSVSASPSPKPPESPVLSSPGSKTPNTPVAASPKPPATPKTPGTPKEEKKKTTFAEDTIDDEENSGKATRAGTPAVVDKPDPPDAKSMKRSASGRSIKSEAASENGATGNGQPSTNGVAVSPTKKAPTKPKTVGSPIKSPSKSIKSLPRTPEAGPPSTTEKKKVPMNKVQVGAAPSPNLKTVRSKIGSLDNASYRPGGGKIKIENRKLDFSNAQPKIAAKNDKYMPSGGDKKITQVKLQWNAKPKVGSLDNATYKPGGGDKKIETIKVDFKDKAKPKVGSKDNAKHVPGGGTVKIETQKIDIKAESKIGSMDNMKHKPGGGDKKIFDDKDYLRQMGGASNAQSVNGSGTQEKDPNPPPSTPTRIRPTSITPMTPEALRTSLIAKTPETSTEPPTVRALTATLSKPAIQTPRMAPKSPKSRPPSLDLSNSSSSSSRKSSPTVHFPSIAQALPDVLPEQREPVKFPKLEPHTLTNRARLA
ncbi:pollen-specific leucine-rich repeat extensin-like protein 1 isoform X2 [Cotesia glomerata]|uniref:pollen-specific leucine-rich repeat extensin-like protein 1 isoform X2 n=1 Tax=Cotesia glomerata TaxID=32391 RepID=UPI001D02D29F|nr:pollen-specific leucine-rich repeat extensin-like protein 1 isoform X2 [Cotesia glomerata]